MNCVLVVLLGKLVLLVLELQICDVAVAYSRILVVLAFEHGPHACQLHDGQRVFHVHKVVVHALFVANQVSENIIQLVDFCTLVTLLVDADLPL